MKNTKQERKSEEEPYISHLNCYTKPYTSLNFVSVKDENITMYATDFHYFCSALVAMKQIQNLRSNSSLKVDFVMIISNTKKIEQILLDQWISEGGIIKEFESFGKKLHALLDEV